MIISMTDLCKSTAYDASDRPGESYHGWQQEADNVSASCGWLPASYMIMNRKHLQSSIINERVMDQQVVDIWKY